jgi:hypothetical protein
MSKRIGNLTIISAEEDDVCELCGAVAETRPYGPNGERICYDCAMKNKATTEKMMGKFLFGDTEPQ